MSSYLLLRNNKESGPFTIEEIQAMSLKSYDLLWVVGKSAAWRYPGEIAELRSFAPPVPDQLSDLYSRKPGTKKTDQSRPEQDPLPAKKTEAGINRPGESNGQRISSVRPVSVYVNLPAEKKTFTKQQDRILFEPDQATSLKSDPAYDFSNLYKRHSSKTTRLSGKVLWISTIFLLFGAGILTGFFISDRRKFFSTGDKPTQLTEQVRPEVLNDPKEISSPKRGLTPSSGNLAKAGLNGTTVDSANSISASRIKGKVKKDNKPDTSKKDSVAAPPPQISATIINDSLKQNSLPKSDIIYQRIKANPENYISLEAGRFSTGVFGGISSFPVSLTNNSPVKLDLVLVSVEYIQNNGKIFKTETLSFNDLQPGETVTLKAPKSPRGIKINTSMHLVNSHQPDLRSSN